MSATSVRIRPTTTCNERPPPRLVTGCDDPGARVGPARPGVTSSLSITGAGAMTDMPMGVTAEAMQEHGHSPGVALRSLVIGLTAFLTVVDLFATQAILPSLTRHYGVTPGAMGFAVNASTIGMAVAGLAVGSFSPHIDRRAGILASLLLLAIPTSLLAVAPNLTVFTILRIVQGLCMASAFDFRNRAQPASVAARSLAAGVGLAVADSSWTSRCRDRRRNDAAAAATDDDAPGRQQFADLFGRDSRYVAATTCGRIDRPATRCNVAACTHGRHRRVVVGWFGRDLVWLELH
jgi:Major Facilitator Superfamily